MAFNSHSLNLTAAPLVLGSSSVTMMSVENAGDVTFYSTRHFHAQILCWIPDQLRERGSEVSGQGVLAFTRKGSIFLTRHSRSESQNSTLQKIVEDLKS